MEKRSNHRSISLLKMYKSSTISRIPLTLLVLKVKEQMDIEKTKNEKSQNENVTKTPFLKIVSSFSEIVLY